MRRPGGSNGFSRWRDAGLRVRKCDEGERIAKSSKAGFPGTSFEKLAPKDWQLRPVGRSVSSSSI